MKQSDKGDILVTVRCRTYNHVRYIRQCLEGFVMQKTDFHFEVIVHDDASTDGTADIVREYAQKYPDIIIPVLQTENQYSKHNGAIPKIFASMSRGKYTAACEGDDYWTDPLKLQKQVDFLESHPDYTMVCTRTQQFSEKQQKMVAERRCYKKSQPVKAEDIIFNGGLFISTCSILYRPEIKHGYPDYCRRCKVGDYPLQIMAAMKGHVYYFDEPMSVYRVQNASSWVGQRNYKTASDSTLRVAKSIVEMLKGFAKDYPQYKDVFWRKIQGYINCGIPTKGTSEDKKKYKTLFADDIKSFSLPRKLDFHIRASNIPGVGVVYEKMLKWKNQLKKRLK